MEKQKAIEYLQEYNPKKIYSIVTHVSRSGMQRSISFYIPIIDNDGEPTIYKIDHLISSVLDLRFDNSNGGLKIRGCGMDMGFSVVYDLSRILHNDGYKIKHAWL